MVNYIDFVAVLPLDRAMPLQAEAVITHLTIRSEVAMVATQLELTQPEVHQLEAHQLEVAQPEVAEEVIPVLLEEAEEARRRVLVRVS